jgi:hypothetical protein
MRVAGFQIGMDVRDDLGINGGPETRRCDQGNAREHGHDYERGVEPCHRTEPACERIGDEPAGMRQRELRGEERRTILGMRRAPQQPPHGGLGQRIAEAKDEPERHQARKTVRVRADQHADR